MILDHLLTGDACAADVYSHPVVQAVLGDLHPGGTALSLEMAQAAGIGAGDHVLDIGCGTGASAIALAKATGCRVTGVDASPENVAHATRRAEAAGATAHFRHLPTGDLSELDGPFDAVLSECTLCLMGPETTLAHMHRLLRPGGRLLLSDVTVEAPAASFRSTAGFIACLGGALPHAELVTTVEDAGFRLDHADNRPELVRAVRERIRSRIDVDAVLSAAGGQARGLRRLVDEAEQALAAGHLGYAVIVARRP